MKIGVSDLTHVRHEGCCKGEREDLGTRQSLSLLWLQEGWRHGKWDPGQRQIKIVHVSWGLEQVCSDVWQDSA